MLLLINCAMYIIHIHKPVYRLHCDVHNSETATLQATKSVNDLRSFMP